MAQMANRRFFKSEARLQSPASLFYGGQSGAGAVFFPSCLFFPLSISFDHCFMVIFIITARVRMTGE